MSYTDQSEHRLRFDWGAHGLAALTPMMLEVVVIIDVLRFTTCVDVAVSRGATVEPRAWHDVAARRSLSPAALLGVEPGTNVVLPSPNGSALSLLAAAHGATVMAGCLRNASAVGRAIADASAVAVIAAGERWSDGSLRPALEDLLGAGAVLAAAGGGASPEASAASAAFRSVDDLAGVLAACASGREQAERGWQDDLALAAQHDVSTTVPVLRGAVYTDG